jgi:RecA/RadA recombinase
MENKMTARKKDTKKETVEETVSPDDRALARRKQIQARLNAFKLNPEGVHIGQDLDESNKVYVPSGIVEIDGLMGPYGGIKEGTVAEFAGENSSGKSYTALKMAAQAQAMGLRVAVMNVEYSYSDERAQAIGVDTRNSELFETYENLGSAENWGKWIWACADSGEYGLIIVDSITAMIPMANHDKELSDADKLGAHAKFCSRFVSKLTEICGKTGTIVVLINQLRYSSEKRGMSQEFVLKSTGGEAIGYFSSMRLWFTKMKGAAAEIIGDNGERIGGRSKCLMKKTRQSEPDTIAEFPIYFGKFEGNPVKDFLHRALNHPSMREKGYVSVLRKVYKYIDVTTGELFGQTKDEYEFVRMLINSPAPSVLTRGDTSKTGFEYVCGRIKLSDIQIKAVVEAIKEGKKNDSDDYVEETPAFMDGEFYGSFEEETEIPKFDEE